MRTALAAALLLLQNVAPPGPGLPDRSSPLRPALMLLRDGKTAEARKLLQPLQAARPDDAEIWFQIARSHLIDFYSPHTSADVRRLSLNQAMEALASVLRRNPDHIPALKAKSVIHARAELLYYDPNLAFDLAARVVRLEPHANEYILGLTDWLSGEVRFTHEGGHRVPHDPQLGIDRSLDLLERLVDETMPFSPEEGAALYQMAKALSRRGNFRESLDYYRRALARATTADQRSEVLREYGASCFRMGDYLEASRLFYQALQVRNNSIDQWLLKVSMDQLGDSAPALPAHYLFPTAPLSGPRERPPLLDFEDMAPALGLDRLNGNGTVGWGDLDGDGRLDVIVGGSGTMISAYRQENGRFRDVTQESGLAGVPSGYSINLIDYDNDGDLDLYISLNGWSGPYPNRLFRNDGKGRFTDVSKESGTADPGNGFVSVWGDLDNDGLLDLVIANGVLKEGSVPQIYRNNGNGTFVNVTRAAGLNEPPSFGAIGVALGDYDRDGRLDILINGLQPANNRLYHNDGNLRFTEVSRRAGLQQPVHNGFVCFFFDYNNDAWPDILTVSLAPWDVTVEALKPGFKGVHADSTRLFRNNGDGTFTDVSLESGLGLPAGGMGAGVADLDNDGFVDVYIGTGDPQLSRLEPNRLFHNNGDGTFTEVSRHVNFTRVGNKGHGVAFVDLDEDGDLDVFAQLGGHYQGDFARCAFYRNKKGNRNNWLQIDLTGTRSNRFAVGTQITVKAGGMTLYREVKGSEGFGATSQYRQHFGLGRAPFADSIEIRWPSGQRQTLSRTPANQILRVTEPGQP